MVHRCNVTVTTDTRKNRFSSDAMKERKMPQYVSVEIYASSSRFRGVSKLCTTFIVFMSTLALLGVKGYASLRIANLVVKKNKSTSSIGSGNLPDPQ